MDFEFYTNTYLGNTIPEDAFDYYSKKAMIEVNECIYHRDPEGFENEYNEAICAVADLIYRIDSTYHKESNNTIKSMSSGGQSITFATSKYSRASEDAKEYNKLVYDEVRRYLGVTGLMYGGV